MTRFLVIVLILFLVFVALAGCNPITTKIYFKENIKVNEEGEFNLTRNVPYVIIQQDYPGEVSIEKPDNTKVKVDTRQPNWFERNALPIFKSVYNKAEIK